MSILDTIFGNNGPAVIDPPAPVIGTTVLDRDEIKDEHPKMYSAILLNDDYTPNWTVSEILSVVFGLSDEAAHQKMMEAHTTGRSNVGIFTKDVAETKISEALALVRAEGDYPLAFDLQEEDVGS